MVVNSVGSLPRTLSSAHTVDHDKVATYPSRIDVKLGVGAAAVVM